MRGKIESILVWLGRLNVGGSTIEDEDESERRTVLLECVAIYENW